MCGWVSGIGEFCAGESISFKAFVYGPGILVGTGLLRKSAADRRREVLPDAVSRLIGQSRTAAGAGRMYRLRITVILQSMESCGNL